MIERFYKTKKVLKTKTFRAALVILVIVTAVIILKENNKHVRLWFSLPLKTKYLSVKLEIDRVYYRFVEPQIDPDIYAGIDAGALEKAMKRGADWLVSVQEKSGRFNYWYDPSKKKFSPRWDDNFLRQAGTAYSIAVVYYITGEKKYLDSARKSLNYLLQYKVDLKEDRAYFSYRRKAKLGGIALPLMIMLKLRRAAGSQEHDLLMKKLANMIIYLQTLYGTGQYKSTYVYHGRYDHEKWSGWESNIYPGEAMLALAMMYETFRDEKYRQSIDRALDFYDNDDNWKVGQFFYCRRQEYYFWTIQAFSKMYLITGKKRYGEYAKKLTGYILIEQNYNPSCYVYGSFHGVPSVFTATSLEGLGEAVLIPKKNGNRPLVEKYTKRALLGYRWLMSLQYTEDDVQNKGVPRAALGGFRIDFSRPRIRIDNTQHAISALSKGLVHIFGVKPEME